MAKQHLTFLFFTLFGASAFAQSFVSLHGKALDPQRAGIPDALVSLESRNGSARFTTTADETGRYVFERVTPGAYLLETQAPGFGIEAVAVELVRDTERDIVLPVAALQTQVVVTASGTAQTTDEVSKALTVVDANDTNLRGEFALTDALRDVPGLRIERQGGPGALTSIRVRGMRIQDTSVLVDGFRVRDAASPQGDASGFLSDMTMTDADRVEVLRGAGSSQYGTNAMAGVINVVTAEGGGRTRGTLLMEGGSLAQFRGRATMAGGIGERLGYTAGVTHINVLEGIDGDDPSRTTGVQGRVDYRFSPTARLYGRLFVTDAFGKLKSSPYADGNTVVLSADNPDNTRAARVISGAMALSLKGLTFSYQGLRTERRFGDGPAGLGYQPTGSTNSWYDGDVHTAGARGDWRIGRHQSINAGYEFESENFDNRSTGPDFTGAASVNVTQRSHNVYLQDQVSLLGGRLQFAGSWRGQWFTLRQPTLFPNTDAPYNATTFAAPPSAQTGDGSAAYTFARSATKLRGHVGRGYRAPSLYERFGTYYGAFGYSTYGDPRLQPDRSLAFDAGVDQTFGTRTRVSASYFYTWLQQVIVFDFSGAINPAMDPYGRFGGYRNTNGGLARGVELSGSFSVTRSLTVNAAYTYTNAIERTPLVENVLRTFIVPLHQASVTATQRFGPRLTAFFSFVGSSDYLAPVYDPNSFSSRSFTFAGIRRAQAGASYRVPMGEFKAIRIGGKVDNLFNQDYTESGFRTPGATATGGIQFEF